MSTIKVNELSTGSIESTDLIITADSAGIVTKNTVQDLSEHINDELGLDEALAIVPAFRDTYSVDTSTVVTTSAFTDGNIRNSPFTGWGADFNKVGISFNALRLDKIRRNTGIAPADAAKYLRMFVKDTQDSTTLIAQSDFLEVDETVFDYGELIFTLLDPVTNEIITLTDSDFAGSTYFMGYVAYNSSYGVAYIGNTKGTQSNHSGTSWYNTNLNTEDWNGFTSGVAVPMEHLLNSVTVIKNLIELDDVNDRIDAINFTPPTIPRISLPDSIDAVVGYEQQLFFRGMIEDLDPINGYNIKITGDVGGKQYPRYYEFTPTTAGVKTFTISLYDRDSTLITSNSCSINVSNTGTNPATTKKVLCVGDSLTSGGDWTGELQRMLAQSGGTPVGLNMSNVELIGTQGSGSNLYEGYGGKHWEWYINETTSPDVPFNVTSHDKISADLVSIWQDSNANQWTLESISSATVLVFSRLNHVAGAPSSGNLTHVSGATNTSDVAYNSVGGGSSTSVNPFWNSTTDELDFTNYVTDNSFGTIDYVCVLLTWNRMAGDRALASDHAALINDAKVFLDKMHSQYPDAKVKLMGIQLPSTNGGLATNYGDANNDYGNYFSLVRTVFGLNLAYQDLANDPSYSSFVEFVNVSAQFDSLYNMPSSARPVNNRNTLTEDIGSNGVHPTDDGQMQIADAIFRSMNAEFI